MDTTAAAVRPFALSRTLIVGVSAVVMLGILGAVLSTWTDEEYTLATTAHGIAYAYHRAIGFEKQGPLYFVMLAAWRLVNGSVFAARLFSVACIAGFLAVIATLLRRVWPAAPIAAFAAVAFNPFVIYAGVEIRLYAAALLVSALIVLFFNDGFLAESGSRVARIGFIIAAIAAAYLQYYLMFALVGCGAVLLVQRRSTLLPYLASCTAVGLGMIPLVGIVRSQIGVDAPSRLGLLGDVRIPLAATADYLLPERWAHGGVLPLVYAAIALAAIGFLIASRPRVARESLTFGIIASVSIVLFTLVGLVLHVFVIAPRQTVTLFVPLVLAVAALAATARRPRMLAGFGALYVLAAALSLYSLYGHGAKTGDWARVGATLAQTVGPNDVVAVFDSDAALPLARYYHGSLVRVPRPPLQNAYNSGSYVIHSDAEVERVIGPAALGRRRLVLVRNNACTFRNPDYGCAHLDRVLRNSYRLTAEKRFFESSIATFEPR